MYPNFIKLYRNGKFEIPKIKLILKLLWFAIPDRPVSKLERKELI